MGAQNAIFDEIGKSMFKFSSDSDVLDQCRKIEDHQRDIQRIKDQLALKEAQLAEKDSLMKKMQAEIDALRAQIKQ